MSADQLELGTIKEQFSLIKMPRLECFKWRQVATPSSRAILEGHEDTLLLFMDTWSHRVRLSGSGSARL